jgi:predicted Zn finger-like uncharacterized protein
MYTQCPDCEIAFKVTAEVLKQAAGKVRCGGCGHAFNALAYLSEQMPKQAVAAAADAAVPELTPEIIETDSGLPQSISAEQSAALLKTLDELAGSDIRIEDTGVEWRVLDELAAAAPAADDDDADAVMVDELRFDDNTPLPEDFEPAGESRYVPEPAPVVEDDEEVDAVGEAPPEIALSEPGEWADILGEFQELAEEVAAPLDTEADAVEEDDDEPADEVVEDRAIELSDHDQPLDMDTQFALQAEAMGIELSGIDELEEDESESEGVIEVEDDALEDEPELEDDDELEDEPELDDVIAQLDLIDDQDEQAELLEEPIVESHTIEDELELDGAAVVDTNDSSEHFVPPMTEEEHTVNMQIDQDLMALAFEDEDGFTSTIVIPGKNTEKKAHEEKDGVSDDGEDEVEATDDQAGFETIIMEGESIRSALDDDKFAADAAAAANLAELATAKEAEQAKQSGSWRYGTVAGIVALVLLLAVQLTHQSRGALATIPAFSNTIGKVYRAIGQPVQPAWDITGWRFEAAKDVTDIETDAGELVVYSRLGNNSEGPLPYPLIGISLTDRFEETIGSRMLDPAEYLPTDLDPRKLVEPGNTFDAVIRIKSTADDATGFKLNVCYRLSNGQLRCAIADFK